MNKKLSAALRKNKYTIGSWITLAHTSIPEIMSQAGFEWFVVDMEHSAITLDKAQELVKSIAAAQCLSLIRVGENNSNLIKRAMDTGACGVIVPMVNSEEEADRAVSAVKYSPLGTRGVGLARAQGYGLSFKQYKQWVKKESIVIVQIEHIDALGNLESILSVEGVDGLIVGPYDISASLGIPGEFNSPKFLRAIKEIRQLIKNYRGLKGFHVVPPNVSLVKKAIQEGYNFIAFSLDSLILGDACVSSMKEIKKLKGKK